MLKKFIFIFFLLPFISTAQQKFKSTIKEGIIFRSGVQIKREAKISLISGKNEIVISDLPAGFDESSIQINTNEKTVISDVTYKNNFSKEGAFNPELKALQDNLNGLNIKKENETIIHDTWKEEEELIINNKKVNGDVSGLNSAQLIAVADVFRTRLLLVKQNILDSQRKLDVIAKEINVIQTQMNEWSSRKIRHNTGEIYITLYADKAKETKLNISYFDPRAFWTSNFDLRLENLLKPINLVNKGSITQYTNEDWTNIDVKLTTANPNLSTNLPELQPWFLNYYIQQYTTGLKAKNQYDNIQSRPLANVRADETIMVDGINMGQVKSSENITFTEHILPQKLTIPSDNKSHDIIINENEIDARYRYLSIPKLDNKAYLVAEIVDWEKYSLSSGEIKLYFEGTYVGRSYLNVAEISDTLTLSLGPDIAINVKKEKLKEYCETSFFSSKKVEKLVYEFSIKNNKSSNIDLKLQDQLPIMTDESMELEVDELSGAKHNKETGIITWNLQIKPGELIKKRVQYSIKIPKDKRVLLK
ncbi:MAG: DUF4139 domain-containing protein [Saprospiraceae bacterium]|nr:DUF4139 domain-containing protein [Saprospiraceae bacterium]